MDGISNYLLTQGVLGIVALVLGFVVIKLNSKNEKLQTRIDELQELRLSDSKDVAKQVTDVMSNTSQNMRILSEKIEIAKANK